MKISAELSLYPLSADYKPLIKQFIARISRIEGLAVKTNAMSTEVFGEYDTVMEAVQQASRVVFEEDDAVVLIAKYLNKDREHKG